MIKPILLLLCIAAAGILTGCPELAPAPPVEPEGEVYEGEMPEEGEEEMLPDPVDEEIRDLEQRVYVLINQERVTAGLTELFLDNAMRLVARAHSQDMVDNMFFSHTNPAGETARDRLRNAGIPWVYAGENIAYTHGYADPAAAAVSGWMSSVAHRNNLLFARYTHTGIGIARDEKGAYYFTQNFIGL